MLWDMTHDPKIKDHAIDEADGSKEAIESSKQLLWNDVVYKSSEDGQASDSGKFKGSPKKSEAHQRDNHFVVQDAKGTHAEGRVLEKMPQRVSSWSPHLGDAVNPLRYKWSDAKAYHAQSRHWRSDQEKRDPAPEFSSVAIRFHTDDWTKQQGHHGGE